MGTKEENIAATEKTWKEMSFRGFLLPKHFEPFKSEDFQETEECSPKNPKVRILYPNSLTLKAWAVSRNLAASHGDGTDRKYNSLNTYSRLYYRLFINSRTFLANIIQLKHWG